jgi:SAM-dependent methyltransferase
MFRKGSFSVPIAARIRAAADCTVAAVATSGQPDVMEHAFRGPIAGRALSLAVSLGVFDALAERPDDAAGLAGRLGLDPLGAETLLTALEALEYIEPTGDGLRRNAPVAEGLLVSSSPDSIAAFVGDQGRLHWEVLGVLEETLRTGRPYAMHEERRDPELWEAYIRGLYAVSRAEFDANAALIPVAAALTLADVAGGHGGFSMAMCRRHPELRATIIDLPPSAAVGRKIVAEQGFEERVEFREGDVFEVGLGEQLDVVSAFNLIHHLPEERNHELVGRAYAALRPGGWLAIGDTERPRPDEQVHRHGALSSLLFYAWSHGHNFHRDEIEGWLREAGFEEVRTERNRRSPWRIVVIGRRPE